MSAIAGIFEVCKMFTIHRFKEVGSTNDVAKKYSFDNIIVAEEQSKGRGRFKREWVSGKGGLWFSIVLKPSRRVFEYTFIASLAVLRAIKVGSIKWPNDVVYDGKKVCGILSEIITQGDESKVIVGVGINVNNSIPNSLEDIAISLSSIKKKKVNIDSLLNRIILNFEELNKVEFKKILIEYKKNCSILRKEIKVKSIDKGISGRAVDVDSDGRLVLKTAKGKIRVGEGDVTVGQPF